jgi:hypothetical protein
MATVHSPRSCLPKLCCSIAVAGLFIAGILITGAYPKPAIGDFNFNQTSAVTNSTNETLYTQVDTIPERTEEKLGKIPTKTPRTRRNIATLAQNKALQTLLLAYIFRKTNIGAAILYRLLHNDSKSRISRSPTTLQTTQALETAIAIFEQNQPKPEYQTSEYATGNRRWKRAPRFHPVEITELLNYEVQKKHNRNKMLGNKVAKILKQNTDLSDKIAEEYQTPSEKLKKDPVMALVTRTISTYMLVKHSKNGKERSKQEELSPWGNPFFNKQDNKKEYKLKTRLARSPGSSATTKEETTTEWFLRKSASSPFPIQTIGALGKALNILTNTTTENK